MKLGGGRLAVSDSIDPAVGLSSLKRVGSFLRQGESYCCLHASDLNHLDDAKNLVKSAFIFDSQQPKVESLIWKTFGD